MKWIEENDIDFDMDKKNVAPTWNQIISEQDTISEYEKENSLLKEQIYQMDIKNKHLISDYNRIFNKNKEMQSDIVSMNKMLHDLKESAEKKSERIKELLLQQKEQIQKNKKYYNVLEEKINLQTSLESKEMQCNKLESTNKKLSEENKLLLTKIAKLEKSVKEKSGTIDAMANKLIDLKNKAKKATLYLCKYSVKRVNRFYSNQDAIIYVMKEREETGGSRTVTIDINGKITEHLVESIVSITNVPGSTSRFIIAYKSGSSDTFETPLRDEVVTGIQNCLFSAEEDIDVDDESVLIMAQKGLSYPSSGKIKELSRS